MGRAAPPRALGLRPLAQPQVHQAAQVQSRNQIGLAGQGLPELVQSHLVLALLIISRGQRQPQARTALSRWGSGRLGCGCVLPLAVLAH